ncbi:choice-of-anchor D domain-containing protein [Microbulbifer agarilyticus]|uniref:choice-of-anchor D domain-containing protein n=1 Tax=Microbulbifer agarilyticus TaxID=260552 RepID=UPI001C97D269|nr:choice-of-anchor D domain-containing protein [Microbulbifer agarilyticus]MBY6210115.1 choice-of-anchor D domain-containing protein [Microbulbifer agarilyticus]
MQSSGILTGFKLTTAAILIGAWASTSATADTIYQDNFANGDISGWATTGTVDAYNGSSIRLRGTSTATQALSTAGYSAVSVELMMSASSLENGEFCYGEISTDGGSNWTTALTIANGDDNGSQFSSNSSPSGIDNNVAVQLRFRGTGATTGDYCYGYRALVTGTGGAPTEPDISVPASISFGAIGTGTSSTRTITISNEGSAALVISNVSNPASPFSVASNNCGNVSAGASCDIDVAFTPQADGNFNGSLSISSNDPDEASVSVSLSGSASTGGGSVDDFDPLSGSGNVSRSALTMNTLINGSDPGSLVDYSHYALPADAAMPGNQFEGSLELFGEATGGDFDEHKDSFRYTGSRDTTRKHLPEFDFEFVQSGSHIFPVERGSIASAHPEWEYILTPGRVWNENGDAGYSRVALPFALQQKNANCVHNGMMTFLFKDDGSVSDVAYQIAGETCLYFQVDMWGQLAASYTPHSVANSDQLISDYQAEVNDRMPSKPLSALAQDYPGTDYTAFAAPNGKDPLDISLAGFVIDGTHYMGGCGSRRGDYPYCDSLVVPSYSSAKSVFAGGAMMRLEKKYPGTFNQAIGSYISECNTNGNWNDVTFGNALDMGTGNYNLAGYMSDEGASHTNDLFLPEDHASKINYSCTEYSRKAAPGTKWVYHTSDTYILGTAMNAYLRGIEGGSSDIFTDIVVEEILAPLGVSPTAEFTRRTYDSVQQPFTGWGLIWLRDDVAKIGAFLAGGSQSVLHQGELDAALQRNSADRGLEPLSDYKYNNGLWAHEVSSNMSGCSNPLWLPFMSGYGGISVLILPNNSVYYYFSDDDVFLWMDAAQESHSIRSLCQ